MPNVNAVLNEQIRKFAKREIAANTGVSVRTTAAAPHSEPPLRGPRHGRTTPSCGEQPRAPAAWRALVHRTRYDALDAETAYQARRYLVTMNRVTWQGPSFWTELLRDGHFAKGENKLGLDLFELLMNKTTDDLARSAVAEHAWSFVDDDDPVQRDKMLAILRGYRDREKWPETYAAIRVAEAKCAVRAGEGVDLEGLADLKEAKWAERVRHLKMKRYLATGDTVALKRLLQGMPSDAWLEPRGIGETLRALEAAGMSDEAELVKEAAGKELYRALLEAWSTREYGDIVRALGLAEALRAPERVPAEWVKSCVAGTPNPEARREVELRVAWLRKDWATVATRAEERMQERPRQYRYCWYQGKALAELGKKAEAAELLATYVKYAKDEAEWREAGDLLRLCSEVTTPPSTTVGRPK